MFIAGRCNILCPHQIAAGETEGDAGRTSSPPPSSIVIRETVTSEDLTRLPPRDSTLDGRWTRKPFGLSRVQPIYLNVPRPS